MEMRRIRPNTLDALIASKMENDVYQARDHITGQGWVVDVGANIGSFCAYVKQFCPNAQIICVEPMPSNLEVLRENVGDVAIIEPVAVVGRSGPVTMYDFGLAYSGCHSIFDLGVPHARAVQVDGVTLTDIIEKHSLPRIQFLKLDCQGAEYDVIGLTDESVLARIDYIAMEVHSIIAGGQSVLGAIPSQNEKAKTMFEHLKKTHHLIYGDLGAVDTEQLWANTSVFGSTLIG